MAGERHCSDCGSPLASDQRYCIECGRALDARRFEQLRSAPAAEPVALRPGRRSLIPAWLAALPRPGRMTAALACAVGVGLLAGAAIGPPLQGSLASAPQQIVVKLPSSKPRTATPAPVQKTITVDEPAPETTAASVPPLATAPVQTTAPIEQPAAPATPPADTTPAETTPAPAPPAISHIFTVVLHDKTFDQLYGPGAQSTFVQSLVPQGVLLTNYRAIDGAGLPNYIAMVSGQEPNPDTQSDCAMYSDPGCVYAADVMTLPDQIVAASLSWKGYIEGMERTDPPTAGCRHPAPGQPDPTAQPGGDLGYATRDDPFAYFHSLIDSLSCADTDVPLTKLDDDLKDASATPNWSLIVPGLTDGGEKADDFLKTVIPKIQKSNAYKNGGLIVITADRTPPSPPPDPNTPPPMPDNRVGALLLSPSLTGGATDDAAYDHYSLLRTVEDLYGLDPLGKAEDATPFVSFAKRSRG